MEDTRSTRARVLRFKRVRVRITPRMVDTQYAVMLGQREIARIRSLTVVSWYASYNPANAPESENIDGYSYADVKRRVTERARADGLIA